MSNIEISVVIFCEKNIVFIVDFVSIIAIKYSVE